MPTSLRPAIGLVAAIALLCAGSGCSRKFWRLQADRDAYEVIDVARSTPAWAVPRTVVDPDPRSRFADPFDPDEGPLPPDDPAGHASMHHPGPWPGYEWRKLGRAPSIDNPDWLAPYGVTAGERFDGRVVTASYPGEDRPGQVYLDDPFGKEPAPACNPHAIVTDADLLPEELPAIEELGLVEAVDLAQIHSRDYQTEIEAVYLTALALTFDRFQFDVRYLGFGGEPSSFVEYRALPNTQDQVATQKVFGVSQLLPTGGQWIVEFLNNTIYLVSSGPGETTSASSISFQLVQPLLFGAGRRVVLEALTQAERDLLYAVRDLARFRKEFFVDTVATGPGGGFLGLLNSAQVIRNQIDNIRRIEEQLVRLRALSSQKPQVTESVQPPVEFIAIPETLAGAAAYDPVRGRLSWRGPMSEAEARAFTAMSPEAAFRRAAVEIVRQVRTEVVTLDVAQLESSVASARQGLASSRAAFADALDAFKIDLGLPPDMPVTLDDALLSQFELLDPRLTDYETRLTRLDLTGADGPLLRATVAELSAVRDALAGEMFGAVTDDVARARARLDDGTLNPEKAERLRRDLARDDVILESTELALRDVSAAIDSAAATIEDVDPDDAERFKKRIEDVGTLRENLLAVVRGLTVIQVNARVELIELNPFDLTLEEATAFALANRLDLMNARAEVTDARRVVEVAANALEAVVDVVADGSLNTRPGNRPLDFRLDESRVDVGLQFTAPLDQIAERNAYRAAQIAYQQARRDYMLFEDGVKFEVRQAWRALEVLKTNFEIARQAVRFASVQLDIAISEGLAPVDDSTRRSSGSQGLNLLNAFDAVLGAQNDVIGIWTDYETNRLSIHRDMGIMQVDARGLWDDPFYRGLAETSDGAGLPPAPTLPPGPAAALTETSDGDDDSDRDGTPRRVFTGGNDVGFVALDLDVPAEAEARAETPGPTGDPRGPGGGGDRDGFRGLEPAGR